MILMINAENDHKSLKCEFTMNKIFQKYSFLIFECKSEVTRAKFPDSLLQFSSSNFIIVDICTTLYDLENRRIELSR